MLLLVSIRYFTLIHKKSSRNGSALIYVFVVLLIVSILSISILSMLGSNLKQAQFQQDKMEAFYLAYSGAEMAYSALLANNSAKLKELTRSVSPVLEQRTNGIVFANGVISVVAQRTTDTGFIGWIKISSTATLNSNNAEYTRIVYFDPENPVDMKWKTE